MAMITLEGGLQRNTFLFLLWKRYPKDFAEMLVRMEKYAYAKEA